MQRRESHNQHVTRPEKPPDRTSSREWERRVCSGKSVLRKPVEFELIRHRADDPGGMD
jgi:hypothetical protein